MEKSQLLQEVKEELETKKFNVKLNEQYHGVDVSIHAESRITDKKLFIYVIDSGRALPVHCENLYSVREGNNKQLRLPHCEYFVYAPNGAVENALLASKETNIDIFTDSESFKNELQKYSPASA